MNIIWQRRVRTISEHLGSLLSGVPDAKGLDVGCGNGQIAKSIQQARPDIKMLGIDVLKRKGAVIDVERFDGKRIPFEDKSFDFVMLVDVLHHADEPELLVKECARVARKFLLIKDHICDTPWDRKRLCFMDWVGNYRFGVSLPYNYFSRRGWEELFMANNLLRESNIDKLNIYPWPFTNLFDDNLQFMARLKIK